MVIRAFPPVESADEHGLLAVGGDLDIASLLLAYRSGIFPWPIDEETLAWFSPPQRAVLMFDELHLPRSLVKELRSTTWRFSIDEAFTQVIQHCSELTNRGKQRGTWIIPAIVEAYERLHAAGHAHSVECWDGDELIGGLYGVCVGAFFAGESMFYRTSNASKLSLLYLINYLQSRGATWLDCQQLTPLLQRFGAKEVPREQFLELLALASNQQIELFACN